MKEVPKNWTGIIAPRGRDLPDSIVLIYTYEDGSTVELTKADVHEAVFGVPLFESVEQRTGEEII